MPLLTKHDKEKAYEYNNDAQNKFNSETRTTQDIERYLNGFGKIIVYDILHADLSLENLSLSSDTSCCAF